MFSSHNFNDLRRHEPNSPGAEPMTLGSPVSSPKLNSSTQNYLPPYLFGETPTSPANTSLCYTPKAHNTSHVSYSSTPISHLQEKKNLFQPSLSSSLISSPNTGKSGGPPIQGLLYSTSPTKNFDVLQLNNTSRTQEIGVSERSNLTANVLTPSKTFSINNTSLMSPAQIDPFYTQGEALKAGEQLDDSWVTIFGFPSASTSYILQQFSQYGNIVEHKVASAGNWMHVKYQSKLQAKKALSKNGKIFGGTIMIGIKPCVEMTLMDTCKENTFQESGTEVSNINFDGESSKPSLKNIRPLTQAFTSPLATQQTSQKSGSLVSKAIGYIWG